MRSGTSIRDTGKMAWKMVMEPGLKSIRWLKGGFGRMGNFSRDYAGSALSVKAWPRC